MISPSVRRRPERKTLSSSYANPADRIKAEMSYRDHGSACQIKEQNFGGLLGDDRKQPFPTGGGAVSFRQRPVIESQHPARDLDPALAIRRDRMHHLLARC